MKIPKLFFSLFLILLFSLISIYTQGRTIFVATTGSDPAGNGNVGNPYASIGKAASVSVISDLIQVAAGNYTQTTQVILPVGVSIIGAGISTKITLVFTTSGAAVFNSSAIMLTSTTENTNGNQSIKNIWFDGNNFLCLSGILVRCRSNVILQNCRFTNFGVTAYNLNGKKTNGTGIPPVIFATGNKVLNCTFLDCNDRVLQTANSVSCGSISYSGQSNILFQFDTLRNINKAQTHNGDLMGAVQGNNKLDTFMNLIMQKPPDEGTGFNCGIETWYDQGGTVYAFNTYIGGGAAIDIGYGGANKGTQAYSWYIHDNTDSNRIPLTSNANWPVGANFVQFESSTNSGAGFPAKNKFNGDAIIQNNHMHCVGQFVTISLNNFATDTIKNIQIDHNLCDSMGYSNNTYAAVFNFLIKNGKLIDSINIFNNTLTSNPSAGNLKGIIIFEPDAGTMTHLKFINNICTGAMGYGYMVFRGNFPCNIVNSQNNITFNNAFTNNPFTFSTTINAGTFIPGVSYKILFVGTTNFTLIGAASNTVGVSFTATGAGTGTGTAVANITPTNFTNTGNIKSDPLFVSPTNYHLSASSPGIGNGLNPPNTYIGAFPVAVNIAPTANAGVDQTIQLPTNSVTLVGSGNDPDGTIVSYLWTKVSGTGGTITSPSSSTTTITGLTAGTYQYKLTVTDNGGLTGSDNVIIVVNPANIPPTANAGTDQAIQLPTSSTTLTGSGNDPDGSIVGFLWTFISGPITPVITSPTTATTGITGMSVAGTYVFNLRVTDNQGLTGDDQINVIVSSSPNLPPTANAGVDQTIQLPTSSVNLVGSGNDPDGSIVGYLWTQIAGATATITSPSTASTSVTGLTTTGVYQFKLTVTDNGGLTGSDNIIITVTAANIPPIVNAGTDQSITLPVTSITFAGSASDPDGTISTHTWTKTSGTGGTITTPSSYTSTVTGLSVGTYVFRLTAVDNQSLSAFDEMTVIVNAAPTPPVANAGTDQVIVWPTNSVNLTGSGTDADGTITGYSWIKISGGVATIANSNSQNTAVTGLDIGVYVFQLTVIDNNGLTGTDNVQITVNQGVATLAYTVLSRVYNTLPQAVGITTTPAGLTTSTLYNNIGATPTEAASYGVVSNINDPHWTSTPISGTYVITPKPGTITVINLLQPYDGTGKAVSVSTSDPFATSTLYDSSPSLPINAGNHIVITRNLNPDYLVKADTSILVISQAVPTLSNWNPTTPITYPTAIGAPQLNANWSVAGSNNYTPASGFVPNAGTLTITDDFTPSSSNYAPVLGTTRTITVNQGTTTITVSDTVQVFDNLPKPISASAGQSGTLTILYGGSPTPPTAVGDYPFTVTYSAVNYMAAPVSGVLHILPNVAVINITNFANRIYTGAGIGVTVTCAFSFAVTYNGSPILPIFVNPSITVIATINDGIHTGADTVIMNIIKQTISITWPPISDIVFGTALSSTQYNQTANVGGSFVNSPLIGSFLPVGNGQVLSTQFTPTDAANYNVVSATNTINVTSGTASMSFINLIFTYDGTPKIPIIVTNPAGLSGTSIIGAPQTNSGSYPVSGTLVNSNFTANPISATMVINKSSNYTVSWTVPAPIQVGTKLTASILNATASIPVVFTYSPILNTVMNTPGSFLLTATATPLNSNYNPQTITIRISVYGSPLLNFWIRHGSDVYQNLGQ